MSVSVVARLGAGSASSQEAGSCTNSEVAPFQFDLVSLELGGGTSANSCMTTSASHRGSLHLLLLQDKLVNLLLLF